MVIDAAHVQRGVVFAVTFFSYALYHATRKNLSGVKASVLRDWAGNDTSHPHDPLFTDEAKAQNFLGSLDGIFMIWYCVAMFFWGPLGDRWNAKHVSVLGMVASAFSLILFGSLPYWLFFYSGLYYVASYSLFGIFQACGFPNLVTIMAHWFPKSNRGAVMGAWSSCQSLGNIFGAILVSFVLPWGYQWTFVFNAGIILIGAGILHSLISLKPLGRSGSSSSTRRLVDPEDETSSNVDAVAETSDDDHQHISFTEAIFLPNVLAYCLCIACLKFVNYAFFFWLPYYLTHKFGWSESASNQLSTWYDVGGIIGSVVGGVLSDRLGYRSPIIMVMLVASLVSLSIYSTLGPDRLLNSLVMLVLGVTISGPYNLIAGTIAIDLGSQPALAGNPKVMSTITSLIDGTGSAGSAIGQFFIPVIQNALGWTYVFYVFIVMNFLSCLCLANRFYHDSAIVIQNYRQRGTFVVRQHSLESEPLLSPGRISPHID